MQELQDRDRLRKMKKKRNDYRKLQNRCVECGNRDERTLIGKWYCEKCNTAHNAWSRMRYRERNG